MMRADRVIKWTTAGAVIGVAAVAAVASYEHAYDLVRAHSESGWTARMVPLTVDGLIYASSMVLLDSARRKTPIPALARWLLGLGIAATLAANVAHGLGHGLTGAVVAARVASGRAGRLLRTANDGYSQFSDSSGIARPKTRTPQTRCKGAQSRSSLISLRRTAFLRSARYARSSTSASPERSDCAITLPKKPRGTISLCSGGGTSRGSAVRRSFQRRQVMAERDGAVRRFGYGPVRQPGIGHNRGLCLKTSMLTSMTVTCSTTA